MSSAVFSEPTQTPSSALREIPHWINGRAVPGASGRTGAVYNPATGCVQAQVPLANISELNAAVDAARAAFPDWAAQPPLRRARALPFP